jgi:hypothetical protein
MLDLFVKRKSNYARPCAYCHGCNEAAASDPQSFRSPTAEVKRPELQSSQTKTLLKLGAITYIASRKLPDVPFSQQTAAQHLEAGAIRFCRGYLIGIGILVVLGIIGLIVEVLGGH